MPPSLLVEVRERPDEARLAVLGHPGGGVVSSCDDYRATQVDITGHTTFNMQNDDKYISLYNYIVSYSRSKL